MSGTRKSRGVVSDQCGKVCVLPVSSQGEIKRCYYYGNQLLRNTFLLHRNSFLRPAWGHSPWYSLRRHFPSRGPLRRGCRRTCFSSQWVPQCCANHYGRDCRGESLALSRPGPVPAAGGWRFWFSTPTSMSVLPWRRVGREPQPVEGAGSNTLGLQQGVPFSWRISCLFQEPWALGCWGWLSDMSLASRCCRGSTIPLPSLPWAAFTSVGESTVSVGQDSTDPAQQGFFPGLKMCPICPSCPHS